MPRQSDFLHGIVISAACSALPVRKKLPTAYSYNGTILPKLPEWDRSVYPYAFIYGHPVNRDFCVLEVTKLPLRLEFTKEYMESHSVSTPLTLPESGTAVEGSSYVTTKNGVKVPGQEADEFTFSSNTSLPNGLRITMPVVWSNYDFCYSDGEIYVPMSQPIPVYD